MTCFIGVVWNQSCNVFEVCLYSHLRHASISLPKKRRGKYILYLPHIKNPNTFKASLCSGVGMYYNWKYYFNQVTQKGHQLLVRPKAEKALQCIWHTQSCRTNDRCL